MKVLVFIIFTFVSAFAFSKAPFLEMNPPKAKPILKRQLQRMDEIKSFKKLGSIGEADTGLLAVREKTGLNNENAKRMEVLVGEENRDRKLIYEEIIKYNKLKKNDVDLFYKSVFDTLKNADPKGTHYLEKSTWIKKY